MWCRELKELEKKLDCLPSSATPVYWIMLLRRLLVEVRFPSGGKIKKKTLGGKTRWWREKQSGQYVVMLILSVSSAICQRLPSITSSITSFNLFSRNRRLSCKWKFTYPAIYLISREKYYSLHFLFSFFLLSLYINVSYTSCAIYLFPSLKGEAT